jgi:rare lipoprotein A
MFSLVSCAGGPKRYGRAKFPQTGVASWYGKNLHGRSTASGEPFNMYAMTAAHPFLPFGSRVKVTNVSNGRSVNVRINDRGPNDGKKRIIDVSYQAAQKLGFVREGLATVRVDLERIPR